MADPAVIPIVCRVGNTNNWIWKGTNTDGSPFDFSGSDLKMFITYLDGMMELPVTIIAADQIQVKLTLLQTRKIRRGAVDVTYEIERRIGVEEVTIIEGVVTLKGGNNADG